MPKKCKKKMNPLAFSLNNDKHKFIILTIAKILHFIYALNSVHSISYIANIANIYLFITDTTTKASHEFLDRFFTFCECYSVFFSSKIFNYVFLFDILQQQPEGCAVEEDTELYKFAKCMCMFVCLETFRNLILLSPAPLWHSKNFQRENLSLPYCDAFRSNESKCSGFFKELQKRNPYSTSATAVLSHGKSIKSSYKK